MPALDFNGEAEARLIFELMAEASRYRTEMAALRLNRAFEALMVMVADANAYFAEAAPWALKASDPARMALVLATTADAVRRIALLAQPAMPGATARLLDQLGVAADARTFAGIETEVAAGTPLPPPEGVFPRWIKAA